MEIVVINASPRKCGNTAALCDTFVEGVRAADPSIGCRRTDLYEQHFQGCRSCFACKERDGRFYGRCCLGDDLAPLLERIDAANGLAVGSPIYLGSIPGLLKAFYERLLFAKTTYEAGCRTLARRIPVQTLYTMNMTPEAAAAAGVDAGIAQIEGFLGHLYLPPSRLTAYDTVQFADERRYRIEVYSPEAKRARREREFPQLLAEARAAGEAMARQCLGRA